MSEQVSARPEVLAAPNLDDAGRQAIQEFNSVVYKTPTLAAEVIQGMLSDDSRTTADMPPEVRRLKEAADNALAQTENGMWLEFTDNVEPFFRTPEQQERTLHTRGAHKGPALEAARRIASLGLLSGFVESVKAHQKMQEKPPTVA